MDHKVFKKEEAFGLLNVVTNYLQCGNSDLPADERKGLGRLLSEITYTIEDDDPPSNVRPLR